MSDAASPELRARLRHGLIRRLIVALLLPSLSVLLVGAILAYVQATATLRDSIFERLEVIAGHKASVLESWGEHLFDDLIFFSCLPVVFERGSGAMAEDGSETKAAKALGVLLQELRRSNPSFSELLLLERGEGRVLGSTNAAHVGAFHTYDPFFLEGRREPYFQSAYLSPETLRPTVTLAAPVLDGEGVSRAVLVAHLSLDGLDQSILGRAGLGESGSVSLVDRHQIPVTGWRHGGQPVSAAPSAAVEEVALGRSGAQLYEDAAGRGVIGVYRWLDDLGLGLIVEIQQQEAFAPARRLVLSVTLAGSVLLILVVGGVYLVAQRIAQPILAVTNAAARVRAGDLNVRASVPTRDEVGALAETFNSMVEELAADRRVREMAEAEREDLIAELEAKNSELERFAYTVSHDLKSPLVTLHGFLGFLKRDVEEGNRERMTRDMERIRAAAGTMEKLIDDLLELSRAGRELKDGQPVALAELVPEVCELLDGAIKERGVEIVVALDLPVVLGDPTRLRQVFQNLVSNAVCYLGDTREPSIEIGRRTDADSSAMRQVLLFVRDNGMGIAPEDQDRVFGLFERLSPQEATGSGVGLAVAQRVVEAHGGKIWVESEGPGRGATFCFTLPLATDRASIDDMTPSG